MKNVIFLILATFLFFGCATSKKTKEVKETEKIHKSDKETKKDSTSNTVKTLPTENGMEFNLEDLSKMMGDFVQKINAGNGNESVIEKRGNKLIVTNKNSGSEQKEVKVNKEEKQFVYDSEYILNESSKIIERIPFKFYLIFWIIVIIYFRKFISQILVAIFPVLGTKRIFQLFIGK